MPRYVPTESMSRASTHTRHVSRGANTDTGRTNNTRDSRAVVHAIPTMTGRPGLHLTAIIHFNATRVRQSRRGRFAWSQYCGGLLLGHSTLLTEWTTSLTSTEP